MPFRSRVIAIRAMLWDGGYGKTLLLVGIELTRKKKHASRCATTRTYICGKPRISASGLLGADHQPRSIAESSKSQAAPWQAYRPAG